MVSASLILLATLAGSPTEPTLQSVSQQDTALASPAGLTEQETTYRRERYVYPTTSRRNPFVSLLELDEAGPQFDNLDLVGVIFGGSLGSVATLIDRATDKRYRVRRGGAVGNARVVEIRPDAVVFQVTEFGMTRSETLRIRKEKEEGRG